MTNVFGFLLTSFQICLLFLFFTKQPEQPLVAAFPADPFLP